MSRSVCRAYRRSVVALCAVCLLSVAPAPAQPRAGDPVSARAFEIHYQALTDAADVISPLLSEQGKMTLRPRLSPPTLVVEDRLSVLERVRDLLTDWDLPPQNVEITLSLFLGTDSRTQDPRAPQADHGLSKEVRGVLDKLSDFTKWTNYEPLGSRSVTGTEGDTVVANLSDEFRVTIVVESVDPNHGTVKFEKLQLQRITREDDGSESIEDMYTAGAVLPAGKLKLIGAAVAPDSKRVLFLALQTRPR